MGIRGCGQGRRGQTGGRVGSREVGGEGGQGGAAMRYEWGIKGNSGKGEAQGAQDEKGGDTRKEEADSNGMKEG